MAVSLTILAATLLIGMLIGCTISERILEARTRRQAAVQLVLNRQWHELSSRSRELEAARREIAQQRDAEQHRPTRH